MYCILCPVLSSLWESKQLLFLSLHFLDLTSFMHLQLPILLTRIDLKHHGSFIILSLEQVQVHSKFQRLLLMHHQSLIQFPLYVR